MAGRTVRYLNFSVTLDIPFDPVLRLKLMYERGDVKSCEYWFEKANLYQNLLESGNVKNLSELARMEKVSKARISQIMALRNLAPEIKNWLLEIADTTIIPKQKITEKKLRQIATIRNHKQQIQKFREFLKSYTTMKIELNQD
jgi:hypothetical protein